MTNLTMTLGQTSGNSYEPAEPLAVDLNDPRRLRELLIRYAERVEYVENQLATTQPKADAFDEFIHRQGEISVDEAAKMLLGWSGIRLFDRLRRAGWLSRRNGINTPLLWAIEQGLMVVRPKILPNGRFYTQPMLTPKGLGALRVAIRGNDLFLIPRSS